MQKINIFVLALLWPVHQSLAQTPARAIVPLEIGDTLPAITLDKVYNYPATEMPLSAFKGKLIILDFWTSWCSSCLKGFPKMQALQEEFAGQLQVILVDTYGPDDDKKVAPLLAKQKDKEGRPIHLPYSLQQTKLMDYFPHRYVPHYVWIGPDGRILAITSPDEVTPENIRAVLAGKKPVLHEKKDLMDFDPQQPLFVAGNGGKGEDFLYRSILTGYREGLGISEGTLRDSTGKITRFFLLNNPLKRLLEAAWPELEGPPNRIIIESRHPALQPTGSMTAAGKYENAYCFDLSGPPCTLEELRTAIRSDIGRALRLTVVREERTVNCLVLRKTPLPANQTPGPTGRLGPTDQPGASNQHQSLTDLLDLLNGLNATRHLPIIDETGTPKALIQAKLTPNPETLDLKSIKKFLEGEGLTCTEEPRSLAFSVIRDN